MKLISRLALGRPPTPLPFSSIGFFASPMVTVFYLVWCPHWSGGTWVWCLMLLSIIFQLYLVGTCPSSKYNSCMQMSSPEYLVIFIIQKTVRE